MASVAVAVTQVVHGLTPADTESGGSVGLLAGSVLLVASLAAVYGLKVGRLWAPRLTVALCIGAGLWAAYEAFISSTG